jgi:hypothetical protein
LNEDFRDILSFFLQEGVRFLVVGAHAMAVHGVPRATGDIERGWNGRVQSRIGGLDVPFLGRAELLLNKRATGRPKDVADLAELERD